MRNMTVRNIPPDVSDALDRERRRRGKSLNQTVIDLLTQGLGVSKSRSNGLAPLAGTWSSEEFDTFQKAILETEQIDQELWR